MHSINLVNSIEFKGKGRICNILYKLYPNVLSEIIIDYLNVEITLIKCSLIVFKFHIFDNIHVPGNSVLKYDSEFVLDCVDSNLPPLTNNIYLDWLDNHPELKLNSKNIEHKEFVSIIENNYIFKIIPLPEVILKFKDNKEIAYKESFYISSIRNIEIKGSYKEFFIRLNNEMYNFIPMFQKGFFLYKKHPELVAP